jgi:hypothetical protein
MDLFASRLNCQISKFASWKPDPDAVVIDAFSFPWSNEYYYIFLLSQNKIHLLMYVTYYFCVLLRQDASMILVAFLEVPSLS